jgi:nucleoside 2-deoxyribosyltransferase
MQTIYLAGPISGCSYAGCTGWREYAKEKLSPYYKVLTPMRGKEALSHIECFHARGYDGVASDQNIYRRDKYDVHRSDALLIHLSGSTKVSIGTMFEIAWAEKAGKFILVTLDESNIHEHVFVLQAASMVVTALDDAINYFTGVLNS